MESASETALHCMAAFRFLCDEFGFSTPKLIVAGREQNVVFTKGERSVSINTEPGAFPLVELYYPTQTIENRQIPHIRPDTGKGKKALNPYLTPDLQRFLERYAEALRMNEGDFLRAEG